MGAGSSMGCCVPELAATRLARLAQWQQGKEGNEIDVGAIRRRLGCTSPPRYNASSRIPWTTTDVVKIAVDGKQECKIDVCDLCDFVCAAWLSTRTNAAERTRAELS